MASKKKKVSKKKEVLTALFESCREKDNYYFDNERVLEFAQSHNFRNHFDATKIDHSSLLPDIVRNAGYCVVHLGLGKHCFLKALDIWYHELEVIPPENKKIWEYKPDLLDHSDDSESNIISLVQKQNILQDFLYGDTAKQPKMYASRRTKITATYRVGEDEIKVEKLQIEIDVSFEQDGNITVVEAKNGFSKKDFAVYQIFLPFLNHHKIKRLPGTKNVECCYLLYDKQKKAIRLYRYSFQDPNNIGSIHLAKSAEYKLERAP